jgi:hypothetical protein
MVLCVKYRRKLLLDIDRINYIKNICSEISEKYWFDFEASSRHDNSQIQAVLSLLAVLAALNVPYIEEPPLQGLSR